MSERDYRTDCDPEAGGKSPDFGAERFTFTFHLEDGEKLSLSMGREGFDDLANLILNLLVELPASGS